MGFPFRFIVPLLLSKGGTASSQSGRNPLNNHMRPRPEQADGTEDRAARDVPPMRFSLRRTIDVISGPDDDGLTMRSCPTAIIVSGLTTPGAWPGLISCACCRGTGTSTSPGASAAPAPARAQLTQLQDKK